MLSMTMQFQVIQALQISGGATESIFPQVEAWLISESDHMKALEFVAHRKVMERYKSIIDFLFCEIYVRYQGACHRFYNDDGPLLKEMINAEQLVQFNNTLLKGLEIAYDMFCEQRRSNWDSFRYRVLREAA